MEELNFQKDAHCFYSEDFEIFFYFKDYNFGKVISD